MVHTHSSAVVASIIGSSFILVYVLRTPYVSQSLHLISQPKILVRGYRLCFLRWPSTNIKTDFLLRNIPFDCKSDLHQPNAAPFPPNILRICTFRSRFMYRILKAHTHTRLEHILLEKVLGLHARGLRISTEIRIYRSMNDMSTRTHQASVYAELLEGE